MERGESWISASAQRATAAIVIMMILSACDGDARAPAGQDGSENASLPAAPSPSSALPSHPSTAQPAPSAEGDAGAAETENGAAAMTGTWEGRYDAKKGSLVLPPKVKDTVRTKDDGKTAIGRGIITLRIEPDGELRGTAKGALGDATITGKVDGEMIRASVYPDDPRGEHAMTGILVGMLKDGSIRAELRVTGPDAVLIRESDVELRPK